MPAITATDMTGTGDRVVTVTTLDGSTDTLTYNRAKNPVLVLSNSTAGALTPTITGDAASADYPVPRAGSIDLSSGFSLASIADGTTVAIPLNSIGAYLSGSVTISTGTGLEAQLLEF